MQTKFYNCPGSEEFKKKLLPTETPEFIHYTPDWNIVNGFNSDYTQYANILIIGHGGSITSALGIYSALQHLANKKAYFLNTIDPDYIFSLKQSLKPENTLVIPISQSGETVTQIEALLQFTQYPMLVIAGRDTALWTIGQRLGATTIPHPTIGGRYTGITEVALLPMAICGIPVTEISAGAKMLFHAYEKNNLAWQAASTMWQLEQKGYVDVFMPIYSHSLFPFSQLVMQLCHESFGKNGLGQTYAAFEAPESQHHTNQRFFGGRHNMAGWFLNVDHAVHSTITQVAPGLQSVHIKNESLFTLNKLPLHEALHFELEGTLENAKIQGIPILHTTLTSLNPSEIGQFMAFWQLYALYASLLRQVNPFDQPEVENSKQISFNKRIQHKNK